MKHNPYDAPEEEFDAPPVETGVRLIRAALFGHIAVVAICGIVVAWDSGRLSMPEQWTSVMHFCMFIAPFTLVINPTLLIAAVQNSQLHSSRRIAVYAVDVGIVITHMIALFPAIQ